MNLWSYITANTSEESIPRIVMLLANNWKPRLCKVCSKPVIIKGLRIYDYCSNRCTIASSSVQSKTKATCYEKYGKRFNYTPPEKFNVGDHHLQRNMKNLQDLNNPAILEKLQKETWVDVADHFGLSKNSHSSAHKLMNKIGYPISSMSGTSGLELEVANFVTSIVDCEVVTNTKSVITPYELDVYIPSKKLAIEFDGLYYHSSGSRYDDSIIMNKHLQKTEMCEKLGITLLHIFEHEWLNKRAIWESVIRSKLGVTKKIYARDTIMRDVPLGEAKEFCEQNHLQGYSPASIAKGLYTSDGKLVIIVTLGRPRYNSAYEYELIRMCSLRDITVVGGASKLTKNLSFISYANRRWSNGRVYEALGMRYIGVSKPCYWYISRGAVYHRSSFMKHKLSQKLQHFDAELSEVDNCYANGLRRIWDCGNFIYVKESNK